MRIIPYTPRIRWARVAMILVCGAHARRNLTAAHRRAQDDRVLPLMGVIASTWRTQAEHLCLQESPQRCLDAALGIGEEHVGSLAWLCRVLQASGRFSALRRSLQVIYRKAHHGCAITTSINAVNGLSEIGCAFRVPCSVGKLSWSGANARSAHYRGSALMQGHRAGRFPHG